MNRGGIFDRLLTGRDKLKAQESNLQLRVKELAGDKQGRAALGNCLRALLESIEDDKLFESFTLLLQALENQTPLEDLPVKPLTLLQEMGSGTPLPRPALPMNLNQIFTGMNGEVTLYNELLSEIESADEICFFVSFIKRMGVTMLESPLRRFCAAHPGKLKILTSVYIGATEEAALDLLVDLGAKVKVCFEDEKQRMHAKAFIFRRDSGSGSAYVGSANLSRQALLGGLEWNIKISQLYDPNLYASVNRAFDYFAQTKDFQDYDSSSKAKTRLQWALKRERGRGRAQDGSMAIFDLRPFDYQKEILEKLKIQRERYGRCRNLVVAATGTGKTMLAAFDYKSFALKRQGEGKSARFLFAVHREEILGQALKTFRAVLRDQNFGEIILGSRPIADDSALFISIQSLRRRFSEITAARGAESYDYIVVDEVHHGAASSYRELLTKLKPQILLGLTATPERGDGADIYRYFDGRIAAAIRLPQALQRGLLCPFAYFAVSDSVDLSNLKLQGGDYKVSDLEDLFVNNPSSALMRAQTVIDKLRQYFEYDLKELRALGFCVSVEHAKFMAESFNRAGIKAAALNAKSPRELRENVQNSLKSGEIPVIFTVDLYNEGVDLPYVNTLLLLRPTASLTVYLQQLGRGLRRFEGKEYVLVLDFIAKSARNFDFSERFEALCCKKEPSLKEAVTRGFETLPPGCSVTFEKEAQQVVLERIKGAENSQKVLQQKLTSLIVTHRSEGRELPTFEDFLESFSLEPYEVYEKAGAFEQLRRQALVMLDKDDAPYFEDGGFAQEDLRLLRQICRLSSPRFLKYIKDSLTARAFDEHSGFFKMLYISAHYKSVEESAQNFAKRLLREPLRTELYNLCSSLELRIDMQVSELEGINLDLHAAYTRDQLLCALGIKDPTATVAGIVNCPRFGIDALLVTLKKDLKGYKESTLYEDYAIDEYTFHWQSPNSTAPESALGRRIIEDKARKLLFVRTSKFDKLGKTMPYTCLGFARTLSYEGQMPISMKLGLDSPIPSKLMHEYALYER